MKINKIIILVAGFGTRFLPAAKSQPKEMLCVVDKPVVQYIVEEAAKSGLNNIIFVTNRYKKSLEDHFDSNPDLENLLKKSGKLQLLKEIKKIDDLARFSYVRQKEMAGQGDALLAADHLVTADEAVAVSFGDDIVIDSPPVFQKMIAFFQKISASRDIKNWPAILLIVRVPKSEISKYGVVGIEFPKMRFNRDAVFKINKIIEKPDKKTAPSNFVVIGSYIFPPKIYDIFRRLKKEKKFKNKELGITDAITEFLKTGGEVFGLEFKGKRYDCGNKLGFLEAIVQLGIQHKEVGKNFNKYLKKNF